MAADVHPDAALDSTPSIDGGFLGAVSECYSSARSTSAHSVLPPAAFAAQGLRAARTDGAALRWAMAHAPAALRPHTQMRVDDDEEYANVRLPPFLPCKGAGFSPVRAAWLCVVFGDALSHAPPCSTCVRSFPSQALPSPKISAGSAPSPFAETVVDGTRNQAALPPATAAHVQAAPVTQAMLDAADDLE